MLTFVTTRLRSPMVRVGLGVALAAAAVGVTAIGYAALVRPAQPAHSAAESESGDAPAGTVRIPEDRWPAAGIRVESAASVPFVERGWRSGRLGLDESRLARVSPTVEGVVREVKVRLGQDVRAGDVLAVLDCREVGQAKLELAKSALALKSAVARHAWTRDTGRAAAEMVEAMAAGKPITEVERQFKDRPVGDLRQQLVGAYSKHIQAKANYDAVSRPDASFSMPQASVTRLRADAEAADASFRALCEEVRFRTAQDARTAEQTLQEARAAEALSKAALVILGFTAEEADAMDPLAEGGKVSACPVRAAFAGTVIALNAVTADRVGPQTRLFEVADLSALWLHADVPQKDLPLARKMAGGKVRFRAAGLGVREGEVFYTGDVVDPDTRAVALRASVPNPDRSLKPGMFVDVELTAPSASAVQVPASAVQRQGTQAFVFVHTGDGVFSRADVTLGREAGGVVEVVAGLSAGQSVAVAGGFVLKSELMKDQIAGE